MSFYSRNRACKGSILNTTISELMGEKPEVAQILFEAGMGCIGCAMAQQETIEEGCRGHGFSDEEIDELVEKLNKSKF